VLGQFKKFLFPFFISFVLGIFPSFSNTISARAEGGIIHDNCLERCPSGSPEDNILVDHGVIFLSSNPTTKFADWVAYKTLPSYITGAEKHSRNWAQDPKIDAQFTFTPQDYAGMSKEPYLFDRGHQAPLGSFKNHPKWYVVNYLSNITPQKKFLNQGPWNNLEAAERKLLAKYEATYTLTGPYYDKNQSVEGPSIERFEYVVPSGYWKIISVKEGNQIKTAHFIFPQNVAFKDDYCSFLATAPSIEQLTHLKFHVPEGLSLRKELGCEANVAMQ